MQLGCLDSAMVSVIHSHACDLSSTPGQGKSHNYTLCFKQYSVNIPHESSSQRVLYLCDYVKCIARH